MPILRGTIGGIIRGGTECALEMKLKAPMKAPMEELGNAQISISLSVNADRIFSKTIELAWADLDLLCVADLGLMLSAATEIETKEITIEDKFCEGRTYRVDLFAICGSVPGVTVSIGTVIRRLEKKPQRIMIMALEFQDELQDSEEYLFHYMSLDMVVNPKDCMRFGKNLHRAANKMHDYLFERWAETDTQ